jgi:hypothetical protein
MGQRARVLAALRSRGARGVSAPDFLLPDIIDGGKPITRLAARMLELREDGHEIQVIGENHGCAVYRLMRDAQDAPTVPPAPSSAETLSGLPGTARPRLAIYDDEDWAA